VDAAWCMLTGGEGRTTVEGATVTDVKVPGEVRPQEDGNGGEAWTERGL
jgi:hypothetical protein